MANLIQNIRNFFEVDVEEELVHEQEALEVALRDEAHRCMSNLYLEIERGSVVMSLHFRLRLEDLLAMAYPNAVEEEFIREYWWNEFQELPNWLDF